ncbi:hypothetical protein Fmac_013068 [Flemingia macrophylla]|uniref:Uncharacterized protein n=1 Tax=Flemingia macrophylla TaxID=520843 RepID=A0ABD1MS38_9FABA
MAKYNLQSLGHQVSSSCSAICFNAKHPRGIETCFITSSSPIINRAKVSKENSIQICLEGFEFVKGFKECLKWFRVYFEALNESFVWTSNKRLILEKGGKEGGGEPNGRCGGGVSGVE